MGKELQEMTEGARERRESPEHQINPANEISLTTIRLGKMSKTLHAQPRGWRRKMDSSICCWKDGILVETSCRKILTGCIKAFKDDGI